jgi:competence protein ComEC
VVRREPDWLSALAASSILYLLWKPATVYEMGFQFSVIAVLFIGLFSKHVRWRPGVEAKLVRTARQSLQAAFVAFVIVTPLIAYHFGVISLVSIPANLLVVTAVGPVVILAMLALPLSAISPPAGGAMIKLTQPLTAYIDTVLHAYGGQLAVVHFPPFSAYWLALYYGLLLMLWNPQVRQP